MYFPISGVCISFEKRKLKRTLSNTPAPTVLHQGKNGSCVLSKALFLIWLESCKFWSLLELLSFETTPNLIKLTGVRCRATSPELKTALQEVCAFELNTMPIAQKYQMLSLIRFDK